MSQSPLFRFRLYVAGDTQNSTQAVANLVEVCQTYLPDQHQIEFVDVFREARRALADGIFMTPTLIKLAPSPVRRIVGTLVLTKHVLNALGLDTFSA